jgi:SsrA-binding protein
MSILIENRKGIFNYEILKTYTAGIKLLGEEVKSLRQGGGNLGQAYIKDLKDGLYIVNFNIPKYSKSSNPDYSPKRSRKLLLNKNEIVSIKTALAEKGRTAIPLKVYLKDNLVKVDLAVAKGCSKAGKKQYEKEKQQERDLSREIKDLGLK